MPVSISSNIKVGSCNFFATKDFTQSIIRLNSPPLATFLNGSNRLLEAVSPAGRFALNKNSIASVPYSYKAILLKATLNLAFGMPTLAKRVFTFSSKNGNTLCLFIEICLAIFSD